MAEKREKDSRTQLDKAWKEMRQVQDCLHSERRAKDELRCMLQHLSQPVINNHFNVMAPYGVPMSPAMSFAPSVVSAVVSSPVGASPLINPTQMVQSQVRYDEPPNPILFESQNNYDEPLGALDCGSAAQPVSQSDRRSTVN